MIFIGVVFMKKDRIWPEDKMKQIINSGYKAFDKQTNFLGDGNVIANTQYSNYIRPYGEVECNGATFQPGHLLKFDIQHFKRIPDAIISAIMDANRENSYILYEFFVNPKKGERREVIGYVLTDYQNNHVASQIVYDYKCHILKRHAALDTAMQFVCA